jgi:hypothetical protein
MSSIQTRGRLHLAAPVALLAFAALTPPSPAAATPSHYVRISPRIVSPGKRVRVYGSVAGGCPAGAQVTLYSRAFKRATHHTFAGVPAIFVTASATHTFSTSLRLSRSVRPGRYEVGGRCGGGNFGAARLRVRAAARTAPTNTVTSHAKLFENPSRTAVCGVEIHVRHKPATELLCGARHIPRPKQGGPVGDPFVQLAATGKPKLVLISQDSYVSSKAQRLAKGTLWRALGITCSIGLSRIRCHNRDHHGFVIGRRRYRSF